LGLKEHRAKIIRERHLQGIAQWPWHAVIFERYEQVRSQGIYPARIRDLKERAMERVNRGEIGLSLRKG
jgi:hypothetical protein